MQDNVLGKMPGTEKQSLYRCIAFFERKWMEAGGRVSRTNVDIILQRFVALMCSEATMDKYVYSILDGEH